MSQILHETYFLFALSDNLINNTSTTSLGMASSILFIHSQLISYLINFICMF